MKATWLPQYIILSCRSWSSLVTEISEEPYIPKNKGYLCSHFTAHSVFLPKANTRTYQMIFNQNRWIMRVINQIKFFSRWWFMMIKKQRLNQIHVLFMLEKLCFFLFTRWVRFQSVMVILHHWNWQTLISNLIESLCKSITYALNGTFFFSSKPSAITIKGTFFSQILVNIMPLPTIEPRTCFKRFLTVCFWEKCCKGSYFKQMVLHYFSTFSLQEWCF